MEEIKYPLNHTRKMKASLLYGTVDTERMALLHLSNVLNVQLALR